jgi:hypothetical protein
MEPNAAVCGFWAEVDDCNRIEGVVKEKEQAKDVYEDSIASGHGAYMLEESNCQAFDLYFAGAKSNVFTTSIGNLPPKKGVVIGITYLIDLEFDDGKLKFVIPSSPFKENVSLTPMEEDGKALSSNCPVKINIDLEMTSPIKKIESPSHPITYKVLKLNK